MLDLLQLIQSGVIEKQTSQSGFLDAMTAAQEEVLKARARNLAAIEELEKLFPLLKEAVAEELSQKISAKAQEIEETVSAAAAEKAAEEVTKVGEYRAVSRTCSQHHLKTSLVHCPGKGDCRGIRGREGHSYCSR